MTFCPCFPSFRETERKINKRHYTHNNTLNALNNQNINLKTQNRSRKTAIQLYYHHAGIWTTYQLVGIGASITLVILMTSPEI